MTHLFCLFQFWTEHTKAIARDVIVCIGELMKTSPSAPPCPDPRAHCKGVNEVQRRSCSHEDGWRVQLGMSWGHCWVSLSGSLGRRWSSALVKPPSGRDGSWRGLLQGRFVFQLQTAASCWKDFFLSKHFLTFKWLYSFLFLYSPLSSPSFFCPSLYLFFLSYSVFFLSLSLSLIFPLSVWYPPPSVHMICCH